MEIRLQKNYAYPWYKNEVTTAKGYVFDESGKLYQNADILNYFDDIADEETFLYKIKNANGCFAVVFKDEKRCFAAIDRLGSIPLFYCDEDDNIIISDFAEEIKKNLQIVTVDKRSVEEFLGAGFVLGDGTLYKEIKRLQAGQCFVCYGKTIKVDFYYKHLHGKYLDKTGSEHFNDLNKISMNVFKRVTEIAAGRQLVIPLSGGYDSRYIVTMLKKLNYENIICYTYGRKESYEVERSKNVAEKLNFQWFFVEYNEKTWKEYLTASEELESISFNYSALPHIQDFMAIKELMDRKIIDEDSIVVPGYCGDLLGGSYVPKEIVRNERFDTSMERLPEYIYRNHLYLRKQEINNSSENAIVEHIEGEIKEIMREEGFNDKAEVNDFISINEAFFTNHKVSKFILNALDNFSVLNLKWVLPLWDNELVEYWYKISYEKRISGVLYNEYLMENIFKKYGVDYRKKMLDDQNKNLIRKLLGNHLFNLLKKLRNIFADQKKFSDFNAFAVLHKALIEKMKGIDDVIEVSEYRNINFTYAVYVLEKMKEKDINDIFKFYNT